MDSSGPSRYCALKKCPSGSVLRLEDLHEPCDFIPGL